MLRCIAILVTAALLSGCATPSSPASHPAPVTADGTVLPLGVEDTGVHYVEAEWGGWTTVDGCTTREQILRDQGTNVQLGKGCEVLSGSWASLYDVRPLITSPSQLQIDHVVPQHEVAQSGRIVAGNRVGPRVWSSADRRKFHNDKENLLAVPSELNQLKSDQDPAQWLPAIGRCGYVRTWVDVKTKYDLSADQAELDAIATVLAGCKG